MVQQTTLPQDVTPVRRLHEYMDLVRELSSQRDPQEMIRSYRKRAGFVVQADHMLSLSRRGLPAGQFRITRSTRWADDINPWKQPERLPLFDRGLLRTLLETGQPVKIDQLEFDPDDPIASYADGMQSLMAAPVFDDGRPDYMVVMFRSAAGAFTLDELSTLVLSANLVSRVTSTLLLADRLRDAHEALDREFRLVGEIQRDLLPRSVPEIAGVQIATHYETSTRAGGDYYDFFALPDGRWSILIADVSGHGPPAAVVMAMMHAFANAHARSTPAPLGSPAALLHALNRELRRTISNGQFVTAFAATFDPRARTLRYSSAGHNPPRRLRGDSGEIDDLDQASTLPLAIIDDLAATEAEIQFQRGDRLVLYTDGIVETFDPQRRMFGTEGLDRTFRCCSRTASGLIDAILRGLHEHAAGAPPADDRTLVVLAFD